MGISIPLFPTHYTNPRVQLVDRAASAIQSQPVRCPGLHLCESHINVLSALIIAVNNEVLLPLDLNAVPLHQ